MKNEISALMEQIKAYALLGAKQVLTMDEAALLTGLSKDRLYLLTSTKQIPFYKPRGKFIYFSKPELERWLLQGRVTPESELEAMAINQTYRRS